MAKYLKTSQLPFSDDIEITKYSAGKVTIQMEKQIAFQLGFLSYVQFMQQNSSLLTEVNIDQDVLILIF